MLVGQGGRLGCGGMFSDDYYIHIKFLSDSITVFCWLLIMKLRHKKPLNPYKGQTNNDKNVLLVENEGI